MNKSAKSIVMFYRGKDDSNKVSSATKMALDKDKCGKYIPFEVINLDKRNYEKYFVKADKLPDIVYVWHDEEIIIDFIAENFPSIALCIYDMKNSTEYKSNGFGSKCTYIIAKTIINDYKKSQGTIDLWVKENHISKQVTLFTCDYNSFDDWTKKRYFSTEGEVKKSIIKDVKEEITRSTEMIEHYNNKIKELNKELQILSISEVEK